MAPKRKSLGSEQPTKKTRKVATPESALDEEMAQYAAHSTLVDPMIDPQGDSDEEEEEEEDEEDESMSSQGMDEDDNGEVDEEGASAAAGPSRTRNLYKAPTLAEIDTLRAADDAGGNTFSLQLDQLLASTLLSTTPAATLKTLLSAIHDLVHGLPSLPAVAPRKAAARLKSKLGGSVPFPGPKALSPLHGEPKWTLGFDAPAEVVVAGSWSVCGGYKKAKGQSGNIDIVVVMPQAMFSAKDRTVYRYFHKRAHYLAVIAAALKTQAKKVDSPLHGVEVTWEYVDARRPIISVAAGKAQGIKQAVDIRIHASVPQDVFPLATLYPSKSLIRMDDEQPTTTPQCSASILHDTLHKANLLHLHRLSQTLGAQERVVAKFLALWRIWTARRGIPIARGGSGWFASMLLGWIVNGGEISIKGSVRTATKRNRGLGKGLGAWGALRAAWEFLATTDFEATPVFMANEGGAIPRSEFTESYSDVFVDPSGTVNILAEWEKGDVELIRHYARETLAMLEDHNVDRFAEVFVHRQSLAATAFDEYMIVDVSEASDDADLVEEAERPRAVERLARRAAEVTRRGLTDRAKLVHTEVLSDTTFSIGLLLNGAQATRVLDMGPAATDEEGCETFRTLWGEKAELRRFKDGSIAESVVWEVERPEEAALIPGRATEWLVQKHLGEDVKVTSVSSSEAWLSILQVPVSVRNAVNTVGSEKLGFRPMMDGYDALYKLLKNIDSELPLAILHVAPASELLRYAATFVPHPVDVVRASTAPGCLGYVPVAEVTLQFESSPRWPDDLAAIQKLKLALLDKVARVVNSHLRGVRTSIALDADASDIDDAAALEVLLPEGLAFRIRINHERERTLLERALEPPAPGIPRNLPTPPRRLVQGALVRNTLRFVHAPAHHASMAPMHHRFPSFSTAVRLLKRWAAAHMLSPHISPEALELLVAKTYLDSGAQSTPSSAANGYLRTLDFLASWDWRTTPVFVPLQAVTRDAASASGRPRFAGAKRATAIAAFEKRRAADKDIHAGAWVIVSEDDESGVRWTGKVGRVVAARVVALATASLAVVRQGTEAGELDVERLFKTPLEHYNAVLHLTPGTRAAQAVDPDESEWESALAFRNLAAGHNVRLAFDPASLLVAQLQHVYGDTLLAFHDAHGGRAVGLLWNPTKSTPRTFKPYLGYNTSPAGSEAALVQLNKEAVLAEIARMGEGIIESIEVRK